MPTKVSLMNTDAEGTLQSMRKTALPEKRSDAALRRCINAVIKEVATGLRNTPAVCRKSYINPAVFIAWQSGQLRARGSPAKALLAILRPTGRKETPPKQPRRAAI